MRRRGLVSQLYRTALLANDVSAIPLGNPHRITRLAKNRIVRAGRRPSWAVAPPVEPLKRSGRPTLRKRSVARGPG